MDIARIVFSGVWLQDAGFGSLGSSKWLMIFVGLVALAMLVQAVAVIVMAVGAAQTRKRVLEIVEEVRGKAMPLIETTQDLIHHSSPKVKVIVDNLAETSHVVRRKALDFDTTLTDANAKTRAQVARVDGMVTAVLSTTSEISETIQRGLKVPAREFAGMMNGLKAGLDVLMGRSRRHSGAPGAHVYTPVRGAEAKAADYGSGDPAPGKNTNIY
jgi:hypothetical protein